MGGFRFWLSLKVTRAKSGFFSRLRPLAKHVSAYGRRNDASRREREKTSGTQRSDAGKQNRFYIDDMCEFLSTMLTANCICHAFFSLLAAAFLPRRERPLLC